MTTLFERVGGNDAINAAVDIFYDKILADDRINHFFENISMEKQRGKQKAFFMTLFKGEAENSAEYMRKAHQHLTLTEADFSAVAEHLQNTLVELDLADDLVSEITTAAASLQDAVLNR